MSTFGHVVGEAIVSNYKPSTGESALTLPMEIGGKGSVCCILRNGSLEKRGNGKRMHRKNWQAYSKWKWSNVEASVDAVEEARIAFNHNKPFDAVSALTHMRVIIDALQLDAEAERKSLDSLQAALATDAATVRVSVRPAVGVDRLRIPLNDTRQVRPVADLVGRGPLLAGVAARLRC